MKKGQEYIGIVKEYHFPNKGIVKVVTDNMQEEECVVKNVIEGQRIRFRVTKKRGGKCEGQMLELIERSENEIDSPCPHFDVCGGCTFQTLPYEQQLQLKDKEIHEILEPVIIRGIKDRNYREGNSGDSNDNPCSVDISKLFETIKASPVQHEYRNKMEFSFGDSCRDGALELGLHKSGSFYDIVTVKNCKIIDEDYRKILMETLAYFRGKETPYFHKRTHEGYLRHLIVRKAAKTGEIIIDLVTSSQQPVDTMCTEVGLIEDWLENMRNLKLSGEIVGVMHTTNDSLADAVINERTDILYGRDYIVDNVLGLDFKITPFSFFQTNTLSAEVLYDTVRQFVNDVKGSSEKSKVLFDLYSGTGTITQLMSTVADKVIGVEIVEEAVEAAKVNAENNGLHNCEFIAGDVLKVLDDIVDKPDFIILDPPRDGINPKALTKIIDYSVDNIVYVSCKPTSLARDLEVFMARGYMPVRVCPIDQFPGTVHVETVVLMSKVK